MFKKIKAEIEAFLRESNLEQHLLQSVERQGPALCLIFGYREVGFQFDICPMTNGRVLLVQVECESSKYFVTTNTESNRQTLTSNVPVAEALEIVRGHTNAILSSIDNYIEKGAEDSENICARLSGKATSRVGVLTLPLNRNIGGNLQAFAMMEALRKLGHAPVLINRRHPPRDAATRPPLGPANEDEALLSHTVGLGGATPNSSFTDKYLVPISKYFHSTEMLKRDIEQLSLDAIIAGSDQIWRPRYSKSFLLNYFFDFLTPESKTKRISYAASFGAPDWEYTEEQTNDASNLVRRFDAVSVREDQAVTLCANYLGVEAQHVLDPTMLLEPEDYRPIISDASTAAEAGQVVTYILDRTADKIGLVAKIANSLALDSYTTTGAPFPPPQTEELQGDHSVQKWLAAFHDARFVITDSFHGMAFAILFNKPFVAYGNPSRGMARFTSLLRMVGLEDRLVVKSSDADLQKILQPIDWEDVNTRLKSLRIQSFDFLSSAVSGGSRINIVEKTIHTTELGKVIDVPLNFTPNNSAWEVSKSGMAAVLKVKPGFSVLGNIVSCELPLLMQAGARYRLTVRWRLQTDAENIKPCLRNPHTKRVHVIDTIHLNGNESTSHVYSIELSPPGEGYTDFVLGAANFTGDENLAIVEELSICKIALPPEVAKSVQKPGADNYARRSRELSAYDSERYTNAFVNGDPKSSARARLMYAAHAIEKGLSHQNFRAGFGKTAIERLANETHTWLESGNSVEDAFFKSSISVMQSYFTRHRELDFDVDPFWELFSTQVQSLIRSADDRHGGALPANLDRESAPAASSGRSFLDVIYGRRSVREFTSAPIIKESVIDAVKIASQAPSVCNRQGPRVHFFEDPQKIRKLVDLQGGFSGYRKPPALLLVTCDLTAFIHAKERNQAFIDGGLFLMSLLLGLEELGIGACPLNTTMELQRENDVREVIGMPDTEVLISFIAIGHYDPSVLVPRSLRYPVQDLLVSHKS